MAIVLATVSLFSAEVSGRTFERPFLIGRVQPDRYHMWDDISHYTRFRDVVFSPVLQAAPIGIEVGVSNKLIYHATNFSDVDGKVTNICDAFNVVIALPRGSDAGEFALREASEVIDTNNIRLLRFAHYAGAAKGCP
jgi:hypothetical protein